MIGLKINGFENSDKALPLGVQGEDGTRYIYYDKTDLVNAFGTGTFEFVYKAFESGAPGYIMSGSWSSGNDCCVTLSSSDMMYSGKGSLQFIYYPTSSTGSSVDNIRTVLFNTYVYPSLDGTGDLPDPWESFATQMNTYKTAAQTAATTATAAAAHYPYIDSSTHHWIVWDTETSAFVDTGLVAGDALTKLTIDGVDYDVRTSSQDAGAAGYITFVI